MITFGEALARARHAGIALDMGQRRALNMTARVVCGQRVVSETALRLAMADATKTKTTTKKRRVEEEEETEEVDATPDDDGDDDEPADGGDDDEKPAKKKTKKASAGHAREIGRVIDRTIARERAADAQRRAVQRAERSNLALMASIERHMPHASDTLRRVAIAEGRVEIARLDADEHARARGLSDLEIRIAAESGVSPDAYARAKRAQRSEQVLENCAWDCATGRRIY